MSAKKSWDVERSPARVPEQAPAPVHHPRKQDQVSVRRTQKRASSVRAQKVVHAIRPVRTPISKESLKVRRARAKRLFIIVTSILSVLGIACVIYLSWLPALRVSSVSAEGPDAEQVTALAKESLKGTHLFIVPRDSLFFIPEADIRKKILATYPDIMAVSFKDAGLTGLHVVSIARTSAFLWCGTSKDMPTSSCYNADPDGLIFSEYTPTDMPTASSTLHLRMYTQIDGDPTAPLRAHIKETYAIPNALQLARALKAMNANIAELALRGDEADFYTTGGTRITYVIGRERQAVGLAASAFPKLSLNDGSIQYVDLRFEAKVYLLRRGAAAAE